MNRRNMLKFCGAGFVFGVSGCIEFDGFGEDQGREIKGDIKHRLLSTSYEGDARIALDEGNSLTEIYKEDLEDGNTVRNIQYGPDFDVFAGGREILYYIRHTEDDAWLADSASIGQGHGRALATSADGSVYVGTDEDVMFHKFRTDGDSLEEQWAVNLEMPILTAAAVDSQGRVAVGGTHGVVQLIDEDEDGVPYRVLVHETGLHGDGSHVSFREIVFDRNDDFYAVGRRNGQQLVKVRIDENDEATTAWTQDIGATVYGMSVTQDGSVLTADADGRIIKWDISAESGASEAWTYQHSDDELAHQVTVSPDGITDGIWSAAYDNTIHKIRENEDGEPEQVYIDESYSDSVREVRLPYEHIGTWPEQWR